MNLVKRDERVIAKGQKLRFSPAVTASGQGVYHFEEDGRRLMDFSSCWGATGLGNAHPAVVEAVTSAVQQGAGGTILSAVNPQAVRLAEALVALTPGSFEKRVLFGHAGTDANEAAIQLAREYTSRSKVLSFEASYHGGFGVAKQSSGMLTSPEDAEGKATFLPQPRTLGDIDTSIERIREVLASREYAVTIVETVQCDGGVFPSPEGFMRRLQEACREFDTLLLVDEVKTGLGRSGRVFTFANDAIIPDLITFGKALGNGLPISAVVGRAEVLDASTASCILTTAGNPVSAAAGLAVLETIQDEQLLENVRNRSAQFFESFLTRVQERSEQALQAVADVRGRGLNIGIELRDPSSPNNERDAHMFTKLVVLRLWQLGMLLYYVGDRVLEITPPLIISQEEMDEGIGLITQAIDDVVAGWDDPDLVSAYRGW